MTPPDVPAAAPPPGTQSPEAALIDKIRAAASLDDLFLKLKEDLADLFEVEQLTLYAIDRDNRELYSRFLLDSLQGIQEIRVPIDATSVSGYCARYGKTLNIGDVYDADELAAIGPHLAFNRSWDERSGFRTRQMLAVPILVDGKYLMGVLLLINKRDGGRFTAEEEGFAGTIAEAIGLTIRQHNTAARQQTASQFDHLLEQGIISRAELESAMAEARRRDCDTETVLLDTYQVPKADVGRALSLHYGCPFVAYDERVTVDPGLLRGLNVDYLRMNYWLPLRRNGDHLEVLVDNPHDAAKIEHVRALLPGASLRWLVALRQDIVRFLQRAGGQRGEFGGIEDILGELHDSSPLPQDDEPAGGLREDDSVIVRLGNQIILDAHAQGASDIHIEPYATQRDTVVRLRVDGHCREYQRIPPSYRRALVSRLKIMARLDIAERRKPQDGKIKFRLPTGRDIELRVATVPVASGDEDVVLRILTASEPLPLSALNMTPRNLERFEAAIRKALRPRAGGRADRLRQDHHAARRPRRHQRAVAQDLDGRGSGRNHPVRSAAGAGTATHRLHLRGRHALVPARRPGRHHGRRDARRRDRPHRHRGVADRAPGVFHPAHQQRPGNGDAAAGHRHRPVQLRRRAGGGAGAAAGAHSVPGVQGGVSAGRNGVVCLAASL